MILVNSTSTIGNILEGFSKKKKIIKKEHSSKEEMPFKNKNLKIQKNYNDTPRFQGINTSCFSWSAFVSTFPLANSII